MFPSARVVPARRNGRPRRRSQSESAVLRYILTVPASHEITDEIETERNKNPNDGVTRMERVAQRHCGSLRAIAAGNLLTRTCATARRASGAPARSSTLAHIF